MEEPGCQGCRRLQVQVQALLTELEALRAEVADLKARLGQNSSNSSLPPSANPPAAPPPVVKKPTGRRPGGQPGHPPHLRERLPPERVTRVEHVRPRTCRQCHAALPVQAGAHDPEPTWHQVLELPEWPVQVIEYQAHARTCPQCGVVTQARIPAEIKAHCVGPRLAAALAYMTSRMHASKRALEDVVRTVFGVPLSLGSVSRQERALSAALAGPYAEVAGAVRDAAVKNVDETSWRLRGKKHWLWVAVTQCATLFVIHAHRGADGLKALLGEAVHGLLSTDRWVVYERVPTHRRQLCWAHLKRDFQAMIDRGGPGQAIGEELRDLAEVLFDWWYKVRDGTRTRRWLVGLVQEGLRPDLRAACRRGAACRCAKTAATCRELLELEEALWTFVWEEGVEPTNNAAERALRPAVLWRKRSFGCHSEAGCRFVERLLSVVATLECQGRDVLDYLQAAIHAHRQSLPAPPLLR